MLFRSTQYICKLTMVACNVIVRDALLKLEPSLLNDLAVQATRADGLHTKYAVAAVAMLSHPLPDSCTLPAVVQTLFVHLVDRAAESPSAVTVKPLHALLQGTTTFLLGILPNEMLCRFEEQLIGILYNSSRRSNQEADQLLTLRCLAIMRLVATGADDQLMLTNSFYETQELLASTQTTSPRWSAPGMRKFFTTPDNAPKTIKLLVLQSIMACQTTSVTIDERRETLHLANDLVAAVPGEVRDAWCSSNAAVVQKLQQKAVSCEANGSLRLQAFGFISQLCKPVFLQMSLVESIRQAISQPEILVQACSHDTNAAWSHCMSAVLDSRTIEALLHRLLAYLLEAGPGEILDGSPMLLQLTERLDSLAVDNQDITEAAMVSLSTHAFQQQLQELNLKLRMSKYKAPSEANATVCLSLCQSATRKVGLVLSSFLLTSALSGQSAERAVSGTVIKTLLELHAESAQVDSNCLHVRSNWSRAHRSSDFVEQERTQLAISTHWQEALQSHLEMEAATNQNALSKLFAQACADLEARCENVEQPLRDEQAARDRIQDQYDQLQEDYAGLEAQVIDRKLHFDSIEADREQCIHDLDASREYADGQLQRVSDLERTLQASREDAERKLAELRIAKDTADLEHATALTKKEEELEDLHERFAGTGETLMSKNGELERARHDLQHLRAARDELQAETERLSIEGQDKQAEIEILRHATRDDASRLESLDSELQLAQYNLAKEKQAREQDVQQVKEHHKQNMEATNATHNDTLDRLAAQHGEEAANLERQLSSLREESEKAIEQHKVNLAKLEEDVSDAQQQVGTLQVHCIERRAIANETRLIDYSENASRRINKSPKPMPCARTSWPQWV